MFKSLTLEKFLIKAKKKHGNKFDYNKVIYLGTHIKVIITCPDHGDFEQTPSNHLSGNDCIKCRNKRNSEFNLFTLEQFIEKAKVVHGDRYDYSKSIYLGKRNLINITCATHGEFLQLAGNHLQGRGCSKCNFEKFKQNHPTRLTTEEFVQRSIRVHGNLYDYSRTIYNHSKNKVIIICPKHGEFEQVPSDHLRGAGCPVCNYSKGELTLKDIFKKHNIEAVPQFMLPYHKYEYDFYLPKYDVLIEFHGQQHYEPVEIFGGIKSFKDQRDRDAKKRSLAHDYRIPMIEIHYKNLELPKEQFEELILKTIKKVTKIL